MGNRGNLAERIPQTTRTSVMSTLTVEIPESLARQLRECAAKEGVTIDQLLSSAAAEKLSALMTVEHLRERARQAKREDFVAFLDASPDVPPLPGDEL
jgi:predicted metal-dependent hydrolase